jgi:HSP20 family protein
LQTGRTPLTGYIVKAWRSNGKEMMTVADRVPSVNISETDEEFHVEAELSEVKKEEVKVMLGDGILTV